MNVHKSLGRFVCNWCSRTIPTDPSGNFLHHHNDKATKQSCPGSYQPYDSRPDWTSDGEMASILLYMEAARTQRHRGTELRAA